MTRLQKNAATSAPPAQRNRTVERVRHRRAVAAGFQERGLESIIVIDKSSGLLTVKATYEKEKTAHHILTTYIRKGSFKSKKELFVVHRLDRDTSGVLVFAKSFEAKENLKLQWKSVKKMYEIGRA